MSKFGRIPLGKLGLLAVFLAAPAGAQNIDAGKTPAQIFADTCSNCHRRAQQLKKPSVSFLRSHYTTGQDEAAAMASYLSGIPADPRGSQQKKQSGSSSPSAETAPGRRQEPKEQAKTPQTATGSSKGRRAANGEAKGVAPAAAPLTPPEPIPEPVAAPPAPPPLEPFEE